MKIKSTILLFAAFLGLPVLSAQAPTQDPVLNWMNGIAQQELKERDKAIVQIHTVAEADKRKQWVRKTFLDSLGGLPDYHGPLNARIAGEIHADGYTIEKVIFESLPHFYVTANVYRPNQPGRYPAILAQSGHSAGMGKPEPQRLAANLARKGFVAMTMDPIGQGERVQSFDPLLDRSVSLTWAAVDHITPGAQSLMVGDSSARYFIWDAKRALDYLESRSDVDPQRLGATGCSGGGALTTFIGALDPRLKAVAAGCFPNSYQVLFTGSVPHAEMHLPEMLSRGFDGADFVELAAPTPWLVMATERDFFTPPGAKLVYEEARRWFQIYGAEDKVQFFVGPGPHGTPRESREAIYAWMTRWLKGGQGDTHDQDVKNYTGFDLQATKTGQVRDEPGGRGVYQLCQDELRAKKRPGTLSELQTELRRLQIPTDGSSPEVRVLDQSDSPSYQLQHIEFESEPGITLKGTLYLPPAAGRKPAVLLVKDDLSAKRILPADAVAKRLASFGRIVFEIAPRDSPMEMPADEPEAMVREYMSFVGNWMANSRADLIGRDLPAMRAHDILRGVDVLAARSDVNPSSISATARGVRGMWLLLAAAADPRIKKVWLDRARYNLASALDKPVAMDLLDDVIPGFILHWDLNDLVKAMGGRPVLWTDPTNWSDVVTPLKGPYKYRYLMFGINTDLAEDEASQYIDEFLR